MAEKMTTEIKNAIQKGFTDASATVNKHTAEVIGQELGGAIEDAKKLTGVVLSPLAAAFKKDDTPKADKERNGFLEEMVDYFHGQEAAAGREFDPKEKKSPWYKLLVGVGLIIGGIAGAILLPFMLLWKGLKSIKPIAVFFGKIGSFIKGTKMFTYFDDLVKWLSKLPILGRFISAFKTGFKFLAWPIQVILMAIDFIKGYMGTEGDVVSKIKAGLLSVIKGFIELPVKLFGWIADWFLGLFDIKVKGGSAKVIMDNVMQFAGIFIDNMVELFTAIWDGMKWIWNLISPVLMPLIKDFITGLGIIIEGFKAAWDEFKPWMAEKLLWIGSFLSKTVKPILIKLFDLIFAPIKMLIGMGKLIGEFLTSDESFVNKIKTVFSGIADLIIDWVLKFFSWIPGVKGKLEKVRDLLKVKNEPSKKVRELTEHKKRMASSYWRSQNKEQVKAWEQQEGIKKELARGNTTQTAALAAALNNTKIEYAPEPVPDENPMLTVQQLAE